MSFHLIADIITGGSILCGLFSIICSMDRNYSLASWLIIIAVLFDAIDGKIARLSKVYSNFGREFDSLADIVSFGLAPAVLSYTYILKSANTVGLSILCLYLICGAFRLARFNLYSKDTGDGFFIGLPITAGGGFLASCVLISLEHGIIIKTHFFLPILIILSYLMAGKIKYPNFSSIKNIKGIKVFIFLAIGIYLTTAFPELTVWLAFLIYILTGHLFIRIYSRPNK